LDDGVILMAVWRYLMGNMTPKATFEFSAQLGVQDEVSKQCGFVADGSIFALAAGFSPSGKAAQVLAPVLAALRLPGTARQRLDHAAQAMARLDRRADLGSTAEVMVLDLGAGPQARCAFIGRVRLFLFRDGTLQVLTRSDSLYEELEAAPPSDDGPTDPPKDWMRTIATQLLNLPGHDGGVPVIQELDISTQPGDIFFLHYGAAPDFAELSIQRLQTMLGGTDTLDEAAASVHVAFAQLSNIAIAPLSDHAKDGVLLVRI